MSRIRMTVAAAVVAASFVAAPAAQASGNPLDKVADDPIVDTVLWTVKCAGDALGGHSCHGA